MKKHGGQLTTIVPTEVKAEVSPVHKTATSQLYDWHVSNVVNEMELMVLDWYVHVGDANNLYRIR